MQQYSYSKILQDSNTCNTFSALSRRAGALEMSIFYHSSRQCYCLMFITSLYVLLYRNMFFMF